MHPAFRYAAAAIVAFLVLFALAHVVATPARAACPTVESTLESLTSASARMGEMDARALEIIFHDGSTLLYAGSDNLVVLGFMFGPNGCLMAAGKQPRTWSRYWLSHPVAMGNVKSMRSILLHARGI